MTLSEVVEAVKTHFGLDVHDISSLGSCQDLNFKLKTVDGNVFVIKYTNPSVSNEDVLFQHDVKRFLQASPLSSELVFPVPLPRIDDPSSTTVPQILGGQPYTMHVLSYVKGKLLSDFSYYPEETLTGFGRAIAQLSATLSGYSEPIKTRQSEWDLRGSVELCEKHAASLVNVGEQAYWLDLVKAMRDLVAPMSNSLRVQLVHGDLAPYNVVADTTPNGRPRVKGIIDFGDVTQTWLVGELAIAIVPFFSIHSRRPLDYVHHIVAGFCSVTPLREEESYSLWPMIVMRVIALYVSVEGLLRGDPTNTYLQEETIENRAAAEFVASIPVEIGISTVMRAAGFGYKLTIDVPRSIHHGFVDGPHPAQELDLGPTSSWYEPGEWLDLSRCLSRILLGPKGVNVPCGEPWLCAATVRRFSAPPTTPTFALFRLQDNARLVCPEAGSASAFSIHSKDIGNDSFSAILSARNIGTGLQVRFPSWAIRVVALSGDLAAHDESLIEPGTALSSLGATVLVQASLVRDGSLPLTPPPLFVTQDDWAQWRQFTIDPWTFVATASSPQLCAATHKICQESLQQVLSSRRAHLAACQEHYYKSPTQIERAYRTFMYDTSGRAYLDLVNNVAIVGHCHEQVNKAMISQANLLNTNSRFVYNIMTTFAEKILEHIPAELRAQGKLSKVLFVNSGSEATDLALRIARTVASERNARAQGLEYAPSLNRHTLCMQGGYHGITTASDEVSTTLNDNPRSLETRAPWIHLLPMPNLFRGVYRKSPGDELSEKMLGHQYADLARAKMAELKNRGLSPAVFIAEPLSGNAGGVEIPAGYLQEVYEMVRASGGLCISDEVQVGYGRLGTHFWGFQEHGVIPDIITMAKAAGNGQPLGFVITSDAIVEEFRASQGSFFSSAGGGPVSCAIGSAVLDIISQEDLQKNAKEVGAYLHGKLLELQSKHPRIVGHIHGHGLYQGVELVRQGDRTDGAVPEPATAEAYAVCERLLELGVINHNTGDYSNVLKVKPPLYFSKEDADFFVGALDIALQGW